MVTSTTIQETGSQTSSGAVIDELRDLVRSMPGRKLPGERELAERCRVGRKQVRTALARLSTEGLVVRRQGSGTFAADLPAGDRLVGRRAMTAALMVDASLRLGDDPFFSLLVDKVQRAIQAAGIRCLVERFGPDTTQLPDVDGVITAGIAAIDLFVRLPADSPPAVALFLHDPPSRTDSRVTVLTIDDRMAGAMAADRLIDNGCRSVIFAGMNDLPMSRQRLSGVHKSALTASIPMRGIRSGSNFQSGMLLARSLADEADEGVAGIIAANDWMAVGIQAGLMGRGLLDRYRIIGFDGLDIAADPALGIDSVMFPVDAIVDDAVRELHRLASGKGVPGRVIRYAPQWRP